MKRVFEKKLTVDPSIMSIIWNISIIILDSILEFKLITHELISLSLVRSRNSNKLNQFSLPMLSETLNAKIERKTLVHFSRKCTHIFSHDFRIQRPMAKQLKSLLCEIVNDWNSPRTHWVLLPKLKYVSLFFFSSSSNYRMKENVNKTNIMFKLQLEYAIFKLENWDGERLAIEIWWNRKTIERMNKRCRKKIQQ